MTITDYLSKKEVLRVNSSGIDLIVNRKPIIFKHKVTKEVTVTIPVGSKIHVDFPEKYPDVLFITYQDMVKHISVYTANIYMSAFTKKPSYKMLEKYSEDGIAKSVLGNKVEPDGHGPYGDPSWLLVVGVI